MWTQKVFVLTNALFLGFIAVYYYNKWITLAGFSYLDSQKENSGLPVFHSTIYNPLHFKCISNVSSCSWDLNQNVAVLNQTSLEYCENNHSHILVFLFFKDAQTGNEKARSCKRAREWEVEFWPSTRQLSVSQINNNRAQLGDKWSADRL